MVGTPTQEELEQGVKGYQLQAVSVQVQNIEKKIDKLIEQTSGLVTCEQLNEVKRSLETKIKDEINGIHTKYSPFVDYVNDNKDNKKWLNRTVVGAFIITMVTAIVSLIWNILIVYPRLG
jgi:hypothetical protein